MATCPGGSRAYVPGPLPDERLIVMEGRGAGRVVSYPHADRRGSTVALARGGMAVETYAYDAFGRSRPDDALTGYPFRYTGQRLDPWTGSYHYKAREYSPRLGRFYQPDPARFVDGPNIYAYVGNSPLDLIDPKGMQPVSCNSGASSCATAGPLPEGEREGDVYQMSDPPDNWLYDGGDTTGSRVADNLAQAMAQEINQQFGNERAWRGDLVYLPQFGVVIAIATEVSVNNATPSSAHIPVTEMTGAQFMIHTEPTNANQPISGSGDWNWPSRGLTNYTLYGAGAAAIEINDGVISVRVFGEHGTASGWYDAVREYQRNGRAY